MTVLALSSTSFPTYLLNQQVSKKPFQISFDKWKHWRIHLILDQEQGGGLYDAMAMKAWSWETNRGRLMLSTTALNDFFFSSLHLGPELQHTLCNIDILHPVVRAEFQQEDGGASD